VLGSMISIALWDNADVVNSIRNVWGVFLATYKQFFRAKGSPKKSAHAGLILGI
jgi:hypothetical protein